MRHRASLNTLTKYSGTGMRENGVRVPFPVRWSRVAIGQTFCRQQTLSKPSHPCFAVTPVSLFRGVTLCQRTTTVVALLAITYGCRSST